MDFYHYVKPREFEQVIRQKLIDDLRDKVKRHFDKNAEIMSFGSFPAGLYLPTADMDLVCVSSRFLNGGTPTMASSNNLYRFAKFVKSHKLALNDNVDCIAKAKVPLVKYVCAITGLKVDISFENDTGLIANKTFQDWKTEFPAMPILVTLIKHFLAMRGLNEPVNGGIGGFSVICLVVSLLQHMPQVQSRTMVPEHHLGEVLMEFLDLYGNQFNTATTAIQLNPPAYIPKVHPSSKRRLRNTDYLPDRSHCLFKEPTSSKVLHHRSQ
jgi:non-canonical poly(A) RNA polymerase PAPD5/7